MLSLKKELIASFKFALPIVLAQFGFLGFSVIDLYMVGRIDSIAIGGLGSANSLFWPVFTSFMGVIFAIDALASQNVAAKNDQFLVRLLIQGLILAIILSAIVLFIFSIVYWNFATIINNPQLLVYAKPYFLIVALSAPLLLLFTVFQRYWQARGVTYSILFIVVAANIVNFFCNEILIFGKLGMPALGIKGAAISTTICRLFMLLAVVVLTLKNLPYAKIRKEMLLDIPILKKMFALGIPVGFMLFFEVSVFAVATQFTTRISALSTSAHQIGIVLISVFYTIPVGISNAAAYRVGFFAGKGEYTYAKSIGNLAIASSAIIMGFISIVLYYNATFIFSLFTDDIRVIQMGPAILLWIAVSQVFDGAQATVAGCLRGVSRTQMSSFVTLFGHYAIGLTLAYYLCFISNKGLEGLWMGLAIGLIAISFILMSYWLSLSSNQLLPKKE